MEGIVGVSSMFRSNKDAGLSIIRLFFYSVALHILVFSSLIPINVEYRRPSKYVQTFLNLENHDNGKFLVSQSLLSLSLKSGTPGKGKKNGPGFKSNGNGSNNQGSGGASGSFSDEMDSLAQRLESFSISEDVRITVVDCETIVSYYNYLPKLLAEYELEMGTINNLSPFEECLQRLEGMLAQHTKPLRRLVTAVNKISKALVSQVKLNRKAKLILDKALKIKEMVHNYKMKCDTHHSMFIELSIARYNFIFGLPAEIQSLIKNIKSFVNYANSLYLEYCTDVALNEFMMLVQSAAGSEGSTLMEVDQEPSTSTGIKRASRRSKK